MRSSSWIRKMFEEGARRPRLTCKHLSDKTPSTRRVTLRRKEEPSALLENFLDIARQLTATAYLFE
ncbi:MAG TPA: hypothetical protein VIV60_06675 [Polyangiaceae bacterium]